MNIFPKYTVFYWPDHNIIEVVQRWFCRNVRNIATIGKQKVFIYHEKSFESLNVSIFGPTDKITHNFFNIQSLAIQLLKITLKFVIGCLEIFNIFVTVVYMYRLKVILTESHL